MRTTSSRSKSGPKLPRLDDTIVDVGMAPTRELAQSLVAAGLVMVGEIKATSSSMPVKDPDAVRLTTSPRKWVGRGGDKLEGALDAFGLDVSGRIAVDSGSSTGGFTQVLIARGATRVFAIDVGYGILDPVVATDPHVVVMERTNIRDVGHLPDTIGLATLDLSFVSLRRVLPGIAALGGDDMEVVCLFKPQFEVARHDIGPGGVVRDEAVSTIAREQFCAWVERLGWTVVATVPSVLRGAKGNQEWFLHLRRMRDNEQVSPITSEG